MDVQFVPYKNIDKQRWNECIKNAANGLIYSTSDYLDAMAANWEGLVLNDYEVVMPLTWKKKIGIKYLYQPAFFQQGGIISSQNITEEIINVFINKAAEHFSFAEITLNFQNSLPVNNSFLQGERNNYILHLHKNCSEQTDDYILKRVRRAAKNSLTYRSSENITAAINQYKKLYHSRLPDFENADFKNFEQYCTGHGEKVIIREIMHERNVVALALLLRDEKRIYNIISCLLPDGKKLLANYFLYYELIKEFSGSDLILDFEGSDQPGIAFFYKKLADENQKYPFIKFNRLPAPLKLLKR